MQADAATVTQLSSAHERMTPCMLGLILLQAILCGASRPGECPIAPMQWAFRPVGPTLQVLSGRPVSLTLHCNAGIEKLGTWQTYTTTGVTKSNSDAGEVTNGSSSLQNSHGMSQLVQYPCTAWQVHATLCATIALLTPVNITIVIVVLAAKPRCPKRHSKAVIGPGPEATVRS